MWGASEAVAKITPLRLFATDTLVMVMLPVLVTVPLKVSSAPGTTVPVGQVCVTLNCGVEIMVQVAAAVLVRGRPQVL